MPSSSEFLKYVPIFSELNEETLAQIFRIGLKKNYNKDSVILFEHESGAAFFIIEKGKVKVSRVSDDGKEVILSILGEADFFGEMAIIDGMARSANVTAMEDTDLFMIHRNDFLNLLNSHPEVSISLLQELTQILRSADMKIK